MSLDDVVYLSLLFSSIAFGYVYRRIENVNRKKIIGTIVGLAIVTLVSGVHIVHSFVTYFVNTVIILCINKRQCHLVSFTFSFLYLFFFRTTEYFGIPYPPPHTNLVQMMLTLKLVGLAFEVNTSYQLNRKKDTTNKTNEERAEDESNNINPDFLEIFHYCFNYIGVLTGPYYRYRTFKDYFEYPFAKVAPWKNETIQKIQWVPLYAIVFLLVSYLWPLDYALTTEFDYERSWLYRFWYIWPNFLTFRMRIYIGLVLSECVCTMAGLGAYPIFTDPKSGLGPSRNFQRLKQLSDGEQLENEQFDYETIHNIRPYDTEVCTTFREGMKNWNVCIQYWLAVNVYKRFPSKQYRTFVTLLVSAAWHGVYLGYHICIGCAPFYLLIEDVWVNLVLKGNSGKSLQIWSRILWFFKMAGFSYLGIAFNLLSASKIIHYYNSIYHAGAIIGLILYVIGMQLLRKKRREEKRKNISVNIESVDLKKD